MTSASRPCARARVCVLPLIVRARARFSPDFPSVTPVRSIGRRARTQGDGRTERREREAARRGETRARKVKSNCRFVLSRTTSSSVFLMHRECSGDVYVRASTVNSITRWRGTRFCVRVILQGGTLDPVRGVRRGLPVNALLVACISFERSKVECVR